MDDMLGAMLDIDESVGAIMDWIDNNGGYDANALYVTADHDHYLTLSDHFPAALAKFIIDGNSHLITPLNNSNKNPWSEAIKAGRADDDTKTQTEHLADFTTWTPEDIEAVAHYWGPTAAGGNGWGSHSTRPVALFHEGDGGCLDAFEGKGYQVLDKRVVGAEGKIDQVHLHACMMKNLFNL
jgi:alkaline phosphatase